MVHADRLRRCMIAASFLAIALAVPPPVSGTVPIGTHDGPDGLQSQFTCSAWGWALDPDDPLQPVTVRVLVDGIEVARVVADEFRQDLLDRGVSPTGHASFNVGLWNSITHDAWHDIRTEGLDPGSPGSWAPINLTPRRIACHEYSTWDYDLFVMDMATGQSRRLTTTAARGEWNADWSPDGRSIAHDVALSDPSQINGVRSFIGVTAVASGLTRALKGTSGGNDPAWSFDGRQIAFDRASAGDRSIYTVAPGGGARRLVRRNAASAAWAPSGKRIVFLEPSTSRIVTMDLQGGHPIVVAKLRTRVNPTAAWYDVNPQWSPDGRWIAYADGGQIWKINVTGVGRPVASPVRMTKGRSVANNPTWAPDSTTLVFQAPYQDDNSTLWSIGAPGAVPAELTDWSGLWGFGDYNGALSPSGEALAFSGVAPVEPH